MTWIEALVVWIIIGTVLNYILATKGYYKFFDDKIKEISYNNGYDRASQNIRIFYSVTGKFPSTVWVKNSKGKVLDTREKLLTHGVE